MAEKAADSPRNSPKGERKVSTSEVVADVPSETCEKKSGAEVPPETCEKMADSSPDTTTAVSVLPPAHVKARASDYPGAPDDVKRSTVKDELVRWTVEYSEYEPVCYTAKHILETKPVWADPDVKDKENFLKINFNTMDGKTNRTSFHGKYELETLEDVQVPRNPCGRTGMKGRGLLGKWGPNHAADPIVTRFKRDEEGNPMEKDGKRILEFVAIQRKDNQEWAIPGGMVDSGENVSATLKREFGEEALNSLEGGEKEETRKLIADFFSKGEKVYEGYVDDPRNTDNSWMETTAYNFHDSDGKTVGKINLNAGDDAQAVKWMTLDSDIKLYASHKDFIRTVCERLGVHF